MGSLVESIWEQWWLIEGAVAAHCGSSGGSSLVVTPDCKTAVLGFESTVAISPAYSGLPALRWAAIWDGTSM